MDAWKNVGSPSAVCSPAPVSGLAQVFTLERERTNTLGETEQETAYGITSFLSSRGTPKRLLALVREHWGIENGLQRSPRSQHAGRCFSTAAGACSACAGHSQHHCVGALRSLGRDHSSSGSTHVSLSLRSPFGSTGQFVQGNKISCNSPGPSSRAFPFSLSAHCLTFLQPQATNLMVILG